MRKEIKIDNLNIPEEPNNFIVPFRFEKPIKPFSFEEPIYPFSVENIENQKEEINVVPNLRIRPFEFASHEMVQASTEICSQLQPILGDNSKSFAPYLCHALKSYKDIGYQILVDSTDINKKSNKNRFNFTLTLLRKIIKFFDTENGEEFKISYAFLITLLLRNGEIKKYEYEVKGDKVKSFAWVNIATNGYAKGPNDKTETIKYQEMVQESLEISNVPTEYVYPNAGWRKIPNIGWRYVFGTGAIGVEGNYIHTQNQDEIFMHPTEQLRQKIIFEKAIGMCKICKSSSASTMLFLFTHAATLETLFQNSGFPINFILGIVGITNSKKTSLTLEICKMFHRDKKIADAEFTATAAGIEKNLSKYKDSPIIVDDFRPGETRADQKKLNDCLESLVRFYGNRVPKRRMDDYAGVKKYFPIQGVCVLTMEIVTGVTSSLSRMMLVEINKKEVEDSKLLFYQQNPWILPSHLFDFIQWETQNLDFILNSISSQMPILRTKYQFEFPRFGEMYALFNLMSKFIGQYAEDRKFWNSEQSDAFVQRCDDLTLSLLRTMEKRMRNYDKGLLVAHALIEAIEHGILTPVKLSNESCAKKELAYEDSTRYFIQTKIIKKIAEMYCSKYKIEVQFINDEDILTALERHEILEIIDKGACRERSRKLPIQLGNHLRYLYLRKESLYAIINEIS